MTSHAAPTWSVVVPVKRLDAAKTRLDAYGPAARGDLALAFALDVVSAALACPAVAAVTVVTDDARAGRALGALGAEVLAEAGADGLDGVLRRGARHARAARPGSGTAALAADLPAVRTRDLTSVLGRRTPESFLVADAHGTGTTLLAAAPGRTLRPRFGAGSAARHGEDGALEVRAGQGLRRDVDTADDLAAALRLGVGAHTRAAAAHLAPPAALASWTVQATVRSFDEPSRSGTVLTDDGVEHPYDADAFDAQRLRRLRVGQRVRLTLDPSGRVTGLTLATFD